VLCATWYKRSDSVCVLDLRISFPVYSNHSCEDAVPLIGGTHFVDDLELGWYVSLSPNISYAPAAGGKTESIALPYLLDVGRWFTFSG
jgi:hypothetical protein